jgi:hypothetical protein
MKIFKWLFLFVGLLFMSGCQEESLTPSVTHQGYIAAVDQNQILVGSIYFLIDEAKLVTDKGITIDLSDLQVGMQVSIVYNGMVAESLPGQASADKVTIKTNKENQRAEKAVKAIIDYAEKHYGKPILIQNSDFLNDNQFRMEIRVFSEEVPIQIQYNFDQNSISLE